MERKSRQPSFLSSGEGARKLFHYLWTISLGWSLSASTNHLTGPFSESKRRVLFILYYFTCLDALLLRVNSVGYFFFSFCMCLVFLLFFWFQRKWDHFEMNFRVSDFSSASVSLREYDLKVFTSTNAYGNCFGISASWFILIHQSGTFFVVLI